MKMKNIELINRINYLDAVLSAEKERDKTGEKKWFNSGRVHLIITRNLRAFLKEYHENYEKDLMALREKYYTTKETEVTVPADEAAGIEEHTETRQIEAIRPDMVEDGFLKERNTLLNLEISVPVAKIKPEDLDDVPTVEDAQNFDFMVE